MKVLIAVDSFKGSLSSQQAGEAISQGIKRVYPNAETRVIPMADGGEGTVEAIVGRLLKERKSILLLILLLVNKWKHL